ncbi:Ovarian-specific serine/threonine-protein kinase Lok, partial [Zancudomyces culisetae]
MFVMIASAVRYLHLNNITHRDIKLENILVDVKDDKVASLKLADFGLAKLLGNNEMMKTMCGTPSYLAPEIFCNTGNTAYTKSVDIWAVGVILYALNTAEFPFSKVNMTGTMSVSTFLAHSQLVSSNHKYARMSGPLKELINGMLNTDPIGRFTIDQTLKHSWVVGEFASEQVYYADLVTTAKSSLQFTVRVFGDSCTFGRSKTNNITLDHPKVSAHSFILFYDKPVLSDIFRSRVVAKFMRTGGASIWINDKHTDVNTVVDLFNNDILTILKSSKPNRPCIEFQVKAKHPPSNILVSHQKSVSASNQQILSGTSASRPGLCYTFSQDIVAVTSRHASESKPWAQLYLIENGARTINWLLVKSSYRIGRHAHPANNIVLPFNIISNYHLTISKPTDPVFFCCVADKS